MVVGDFDAGPAARQLELNPFAGVLVAHLYALGDDGVSAPASAVVGGG